MVKGWILRYRTALDALTQHGCEAPASDLITLDNSIRRLEHASGFAYYGAIPAVGSALRDAATQYGLKAPRATTCRDLKQGVEVSFVLQDAGDSIGQSLYPLVTVTNHGPASVAVQLSGEGKATDEFTGDKSMYWGGYTDSRLVVAPGKTRSMELGKDTGETLLFPLVSGS